MVHYSACTGVTSGKLQKLLLGGKYSDMRSILFYVAIALAIIAVAAAIYFYIPGIYHPYISIENGHLVFIGPGRHLHVSTSRHRFYTGVCVFLAAVFVIIGFLMRPRKAAVA
jgi:hypothetical protein